MRTNYVFAIVTYTDMDDEEYSVIYIAPELYWNEVLDLQNYKEVNEGELSRFLLTVCGDTLASWDVIHWYSTGEEDIEELEELLEGIGMKSSETLRDYAESEIQEFGDQYIAELY